MHALIPAGLVQMDFYFQLHFTVRVFGFGGINFRPQTPNPKPNYPSTLPHTLSL